MFPSYTQLSRRFFAYSLVGISTYAIDLIIIYIALTWFAFQATSAIALGFLIGVSLNYFFCYTWVFKDTTRHPLLGYLIFGAAAILGVIIITNSTTFLMSALSLNPYIARTLVAIIVGIANFFFNSFFNFRVF